MAQIYTDNSISAVSDTLWLEVQRRLDDPARKSNRNGTDRKHLGSGLYRCGICGARVKAHGTRYRCAGHVMRSRSQVDSYVLDVARERLSRADLANFLPTTDESVAAQMQEEIERQRGRILRARADYSAELIDGLMFKEIKLEAEATIDRLEGERLSLSGGSTAFPVLTADDPVHAFRGTDLATMRAAWISGSSQGTGPGLSIRFHPLASGLRTSLRGSAYELLTGSYARSAAEECGGVEGANR